MKIKHLIFIIILMIILAMGIIVFTIKKENKANNQNATHEISNVPSSNSSTEIKTEKEDNSSADKINGLEKTDNLFVVPTMNDKITSDSSWCGTFQLVWNDLKNEIVKKDIVFTPQLDIVNNLNKEDFNESMISDDYYFKIYGIKNLELKNKIEQGIKDKFNQTSDILNDFNWSDNSDNTDTRAYFFYTMLYRKFEFLQAFDKLNKDNFGKNYSNIEYFGIDAKTKDLVGDQINVLYYNSKDDFALSINTKTNDEIIFCKNPKGNTFNEIYENMNKKSKKYSGSKEFKSIDEFKAPNLTFNEKKEYKELEGHSFPIDDSVYKTAEITQAIQSIKFSLDEKGGEIKSEAAIGVKSVSLEVTPTSQEDEPRYFYVDDTFAIFLREKDKSMPYFAGRVDDITKFQ